MSSKNAKKTQDPKTDIKNKSSTPSSKGKQSQKEIEQLQNENEKLKKRIVIYRNNLDPDKIKAELNLTEQSMINMLTEENLRLIKERKKYTPSDTMESSPALKTTDAKKQLDVDSGDKNRTESRQKEKENIAFNEMKNENDNLKKDIKILQDDNANLKRNILEANEKIKSLQKEISDANSEAEEQLKLRGQQVEENTDANADKSSNHDEAFQKKAPEIDALQKEVADLRSKLKEFEDIKTQLHKAKQSVEENEKQIQEMKQEKADIETEKNKQKNKCESISEQLKISERQLKDLKQNSSNSDESAKSQQADEIKQKLEEINKLKNDLTETQSKNKNLKAEKENLDEKLHQSMEQIKAKEREIKTLKDEHGQTIKKKDETINNLQKEKNVDQRKNSGKRNTGSNSLEEKLRSAQDEIDELKNRLSKVVGANIMNDNPNITDLSDENRPTKLSEKFSELYDNEWTDAYEEAENEFKNEEKGIAHLYKTLLDVFDFCKKKSEEHAKYIRDSVMTLPNGPKMRPKSAEIGVTNQRQLKEVRKSFAPMLIESVFQNYVNEKKLIFTQKKNTEKFIKKCVEICWLMNSQDPPVILDTSDVDGKSFDVDKFRTYTKTGKMVDYVVWPPMLLHKGGPMLCKGVAQGK